MESSQEEGRVGKEKDKHLRFCCKPNLLPFDLAHRYTYKKKKPSFGEKTNSANKNKKAAIYHYLAFSQTQT